MTVLIGGIIGHELASAPWMATMPLSTLVIGTASGTFPAAKIMAQLGRKKGYSLAIFISMCAHALCAIAIIQQSFLLFCCGSFTIGLSMAFSQQMRFAAIEITGKERAPLAVSIMMIGGILPAIIGPEVATLGKQAIETANYAGSYLFMLCLQFIALVIFGFFPKPQTNIVEQHSNTTANAMPMNTFLFAASISVTAFAVMSYVMTATPLSMHHGYNYSIDDAKQVIQWHILAMFIPAFFSGQLIQKIGYQSSLGLGLALYGSSIGVAILGQQHWHFATSLILLGVGWNILFTTGTSLLANAGASAKEQGRHDFLVFSTQAIATLFAAGVLLRLGWSGLLWSAFFALIPLIVIASIRVIKRGKLPAN